MKITIKILAAPILIFASAAFVSAQTPPPFATVTAAHIYGQGNTPLALGNIIFAPVDNQGNPISYQVGGGGQQINYPTICAVANGTIAANCQVANTALTNPANVCFSVTVKNSANQVVLGGSQSSGYQCVQPATNNLWCASSACNFDQFVPNVNGLPVSVLPPPTAFSLGGIYSIPCATGNVMTGVDLFGRPTCIPNGSGGGSSAWGGITGNIASQTDLIAYLATFAPLASPNFSGAPTSTTPALGDNSFRIPTTAWIQSAGFAPLLSPGFSGTPTTTTPLGSDNSTRIANTAWVKALGYLTTAPVASVAGKTGAVTLAESDIGSLVSDLALKAPLASPALTGSPTAPTPPTVDSTTRLATTAWVNAQNYGVGAGNVTGPGVATVGHAALFNATNGQLLSDAGFGYPLAPANIGTFAPGSNGFVASAFTDALNASNISSGTLPSARLPVPTVSTLGGVQSLACASHQWFNNLSNLGILACQQPTFSDINTLFIDNGSVGGYTGSQWQVPAGTTSAPGWVFAPALAVGMYEALNPAQWNVLSASGTGSVATLALGNTSGWTFSSQWQPGVLASFTGIGSGYDCGKCIITAFNLSLGTVSYASTATASVTNTGVAQQWNLAFSLAAHKVIFNSFQSSSSNCPQNGSIQLCAPGDNITSWAAPGGVGYTVVLLQKNVMPTQGDVRAAQVGDPTYGFITPTGAPVRFNGTVTLNPITGTQCLHSVAGVIGGVGGDCPFVSGTMTTDYVVTAASASGIKTGSGDKNFGGGNATNINILTAASLIQTNTVGANTVLGNCSGSSAAPTYGAITAGCLPATVSIAGPYSNLSPTCAGALTWDMTSSGFVNRVITITGACTLNLTNLVAGGQYVLKVIQGSGGSHTLALGTGCAWKVSNGGAGAITPSPSAGALDVLTFSFDGTNCLANYSKNFT